MCSHISCQPNKGQGVSTDIANNEQRPQNNNGYNGKTTKRLKKKHTGKKIGFTQNPNVTDKKRQNLTVKTVK